MKYVGLLKSGDGKSLREALVDGSLDRKVPGQAGWVTGFIRNLSPTETLIVNFYNSTRESQTIELLPLSVIRVKNQNLDRLQLTAETREGFGIYEYYLTILRSESDLESSNLLTYQDIQVKYEGSNQFGNTKLISYILESGGIESLPIPENKQLLIKNVFMELDPTSLPDDKAPYNATLAVTYSFENDENVLTKDFPIQFFLNDRYSENFLNINWTDRLIGTDQQKANFKTACTSLNQGFEGVAIRIWIEYLEV